MMKKRLAVIMALALSLSLAACGGGATSGSTAPAASTPAANSTSTEAVDTANVGEHSWTLGTDSSEDTVTHFFAVTFSNEISALSGGKMVVDVYSNATLGGDLALLESVHDGNVTFVVQTTAPQVNFIPQLAVFDMPIVYPTIDEFRTIFSNEDFMGKVRGFYDEAGYKLLGYADQTFRVMSSNKKVESMADFNGIKIRTMENPNHMAFWTAVGASPTPMAFAEVYTGLQQGTIAAQENPYAVIASNKLYEVQDYVIQTNHLPHILSLVMNPGVYNDLNAEEQAIVDQAAANAVAAARAEADRFEAEKIVIIEESGTEIVPVSDELYAEMKTAAQSVYDSIAGKVGQDLVDAYLGK